MNIGSVSENKKIEKRISITPDIVKKYISLGLKVNLPKGYGDHLGLKDEEFKNAGAEIINSDEEVIKSSQIIVQLGLISENQFDLIKENHTLIGVLNPYQNKNKLEILSKKKN